MIYSSHEINPRTAKKIMNLFPKRRGNVKVDNSRFPDAIIYIGENGCKWRALPGTFGPWHTIYVRINRWAKTPAPVLETELVTTLNTKIPTEDKIIGNNKVTITPIYPLTANTWYGVKVNRTKKVRKKCKKAIIMRRKE
jgi:hypothetical protein